MGKVKVGLYCYLAADILTKVLQKYSLSSPVPNMRILYKAYMPDPPPGKKSHGNSVDLMVFRRGMPISHSFFKKSMFS